MKTDEIWPPAPLLPAPSPPQKMPLTGSEIFWGMVGRMTGMGLLRGAILGALFGVFFWIVGAVFGFFIGGAAGLILGFLDGLILGGVTCGCFSPWERRGDYPITLCLLSGIVAFIGGAALTWLVVGKGLFGNGDSWIIAIIPVLIATLAAGEAGLRVARWCVEVA